MADADPDASFSQLLDKLQEAHLLELHALKGEVERLQARLWLAEGAGESAIDQYIGEELCIPVAPKVNSDEKHVDYEKWASILMPDNVIVANGNSFHHKGSANPNCATDVSAAPSSPTVDLIALPLQEACDAACAATQHNLVKDGNPVQSAASEVRSADMAVTPATHKVVLQEPSSPGSPSSPTSTEKRRAPQSKKNPFGRKSIAASPPDTITGLLHYYVNSPYFEGVFACCIVCNALVVAVEAQYQGIDVGFDLSYPKSIRSAEQSWPGAKEVFDVFGHIFGAVFAVEVVLKVLGLQRKWVLEAWNWFDLLIVVFWLLGYLPAGESGLPVNEQLLRVARLMRLLRLIRLVKTIQAFDSLMLMTTALMGSVQVLVWSVILLILVQATLALLVNQILTEYYFNQDIYPQKERLAVYEYFGTFTRAMLSMFEMTLANWPPVCRLMAESWTEWWMLFALTHKLTIGFAVVGVINGVFMQETFKAASTDDRIMVRQRQRVIDTHRRKMKQLLELADESGDGTLDKEEFRQIMENRDISAWLASMELDTGDCDTLYSLIDDGDEALSVEELIQGVARLKGTARRLDLAILMRDHKILMNNHRRIAKQLGLTLEGSQMFTSVGSDDQAARTSTSKSSRRSKDRVRPSRDELKILPAASDFQPIHVRLMEET